MPKMKSNSGASKRFRVTASGRVKRGQAFRSHILTKKTTKSKRKSRLDPGVHESDVRSIRRMMPYA